MEVIITCSIQASYSGRWCGCSPGWDRLFGSWLPNFSLIKLSCVRETCITWCKQFLISYLTLPIVFTCLRQGASEDSEDWEAEIEGKLERKVYNDIPSTLNSAPANCYRLPLSPDRIFVVDNTQSLRECTQVLCKVRAVLYCTWG